MNDTTFDYEQEEKQLPSKEEILQDHLQKKKYKAVEGKRQKDVQTQEADNLV